MFSCNSLFWTGFAITVKTRWMAIISVDLSIFFTFTGSELLILYLIFSILTGIALSKLDSPFVGIADFTDSIFTGILVLCN